VSLPSVVLLGKIGLIANPNAGRGGGLLDDALTGFFRALRGESVTVVDGTIEASVGRDVGACCERLSRDAGGGRHACDLARHLVDAGVSTIVGIGGDGTLRDIADVLIESGANVRLFGVGVGSSNVGPLVSASAEDVEAVLQGVLRDVPVHAVEVSVDDDRVGTAFNDVVLANTYFGTRDGRRVDLDAAAWLDGEDRFAAPCSVCGGSVWVSKNGRLLLGGDEIAGGQIVVSPLNDVETCAGKAVSGFLCWGPYVGCHGLLTAASTVLIRTQLARADLVDAEPLRLCHVGFAPDDVVEVGGLNDGGVVVVDGSPSRRIGPGSRIRFRLLANAVTALRSAPGRLAAPNSNERGDVRG
jgi:hypothetical protein